MLILGRTNTPWPKLESRPNPLPVDHWLVYVDGSLAKEGGRACILLISQGKEEIKYNVKFGFPVMNNVAEYKTLLCGLRLAQKIRVDKIIIYSDSQLVAQQVQGEYEVKDPLLTKYHTMVGQLWGHFLEIQLEQISREVNTNCQLRIH